MKHLVEIEEICPFIGKPCIKDGWQWDRKIAYPCAFFDGDRIPYSDPAIDPCRIKRAVNKILGNEEKKWSADFSMKVPWDTDENGDDKQ